MSIFKGNGYMSDETLNPYLHNPQLDGKPFYLEGYKNRGVLLLHGFTATCSEVNRLGKSLHRLGFSVYAPLLPGHGTNPADLNKTTWQDWVKAAEEAYQYVANRCLYVTVGGESNGGLLALYLAAQHREIAGVLAYAPALRLPLSPFQRFVLKLLAPVIPSLRKRDLDGDTTWQGYKVNPLKAVLQLLQLEREVEKRLPEIKQPVMIVQGRHDKTINPISSQIVHDRVCSSVKELHWMENSGHCVLLDQESHEVTRMTIDFLYKVMPFNR